MLPALIMEGRGWGDAQASIAVAEQWAKESGKEVVLAMPGDYWPLADNIEGIKLERLSDAWGNKYTRSVAFHDSVHKYEEALMPNVDRGRMAILAQKIGLKGKPQVKIILSEREKEIVESIREKLDGSEKAIVGIIPTSIMWPRSWTGWEKVVWELHARDRVQVMSLIKEVDDWETLEIVSNSYPVVDMPIRDVVLYLAACDVVIGVDTGPMHTATALGKPTLWLFTHIGGEVRTQWYPKVEVLQRVDLPCCPCWYKPKCWNLGQHMSCKVIEPSDVLERLFGMEEIKNKIGGNENEKNASIGPGVSGVAGTV